MPPILRFWCNKQKTHFAVDKVYAPYKQGTKKRLRVEATGEDTAPVEGVGDKEVSIVKRQIALGIAGHRGSVRSIPISEDERILLSASLRSRKM